VIIKQIKKSILNNFIIFYSTPASLDTICLVFWIIIELTHLLLIGIVYLSLKNFKRSYL